jgi:hypothetical protein
MATPVPLTTNNGSTYYNKNICQSYTQLFTTTLRSLCGTQTACSEIDFIFPASTATVTLYDNNDFVNALTIPLNNNGATQFKFKGMTSTSVVSASASSAITVSYRTAFYTGSILAQ